jgi:hypothetical protein
MDVISLCSSEAGDTDTTITRSGQSSLSSLTSGGRSYFHRTGKYQSYLAHHNRIELCLGAWEAVSFPCLYPSEHLIAVEVGSSFDARCKAWNPGRPIDKTTPWLLSTVVIPSRDERGPLSDLFNDLPEIPRSDQRRREHAHKVLLSLTQSSSGSLAKLLAVPRLIRKCISAISLIQRLSSDLLDVADYIDLRLTLYRVSVAAIWQRTEQQPPRRVFVAYHYLLRDRQKVILVLSNTPVTRFTRFVELSFDQVLYSAQEPVIFEPLLEEDGHGFKIQPRLDDIQWGEE